MSLAKEVGMVFKDSFNNEFLNEIQERLQIKNSESMEEIKANITNHNGQKMSEEEIKNGMLDVVYSKNLPENCAAKKIFFDAESAISRKGFGLSFGANAGYLKYEDGIVNGSVQDEAGGRYDIHCINDKSLFWIDYTTLDEQIEASKEKRNSVPLFKTNAINVNSEENQMLDFAIKVAKEGSVAIEKMTKILNDTQNSKKIM